MSKNKGFTLIELLVVVSLLGIISMAVYGALSGGIQLSKRVVSGKRSSDFLLNRKRFQKDIRNQFSYQSIPFLGSETALSFAAPVFIPSREGGSAGHWEVGQIRYYYSSSANSLCREAMTYVELMEKKEENCQKVFPSVTGASFRYFGALEGDGGGGFWNSAWKRDFPPLAVRLTMKTEDKLEKTITVLLP